MKYSLFIFVFIFCGLIQAQETNDNSRRIDSLKEIIDSKVHDTVRVNALMKWDDIVYRTDPKQDLELNQRIEKICSDNLKSKKNLRKEEEFYFKNKLAYSINNIGIFYKNEGNFVLAIDYYHRSLVIYEDMDQKRGIASTLGNIGSIHRHQKDNISAIEYYKKALVLFEEVKDLPGITGTYNNLGMIYEAEEKYDSAFVYFTNGLKMARQMGSKRGIGIVLANIGEVKYKIRELDSAVSYFQNALDIQNEIGDNSGKAVTLNSLARVYFEKKLIRKSQEFAGQAFELAKQIGHLQEEINAAERLYLCSNAMGDFKSALKYYEHFNHQKAIYESEENKKEVIRQEYKYKYDKQAAADSIRNAEAQKVKDAQIELQKAENQQEKQRSYFLAGVLILTIIFGLFIYNRLRIISKQKRIIEIQKREVTQQKELVEEKNKEIVDSINYAKRLQDAIIPSDNHWYEELPDSFVLYMPKDIVAGDFYWMDVVEENGKKNILFAAADCTGHGVPGAMVSVVCSNALDRAVNEFGLREPAKILDKATDLVIDRFIKYGNEVKDGMDISFCKLEIDNLKLSWAGANNPLWIIRSNEILIYKPDKQPVGMYFERKNFTNHKIELIKGDVIYIFSDGFADQFGGDRKKKYKESSLRNFILTIHKDTMKDQKIKLNQEFNNWKNDIDQIDDVCLIGVRV